MCQLFVLDWQCNVWLHLLQPWAHAAQGNLAHALFLSALQQGLELCDLPGFPPGVWHNLHSSNGNALYLPSPCIALITKTSCTCEYFCPSFMFPEH